MENSKQLLLLKKVQKLSKHFPDDFMVSVTSYKAACNADRVQSLRFLVITVNKALVLRVVKRLASCKCLQYWAAGRLTAAKMLQWLIHFWI